MQPQQNAPQIKKTDVIGLTTILSFITKQQQQQLINTLKQQPWNTSLKRRTQHYGYEYSYDRKSEAKQTTPIPQWCLPIKQKLQQTLNTRPNNPHHQIKFDQLIINQYEPGQGINPHVDNVRLFGGTVVSLSLGSECVMVFQRERRRSREKVSGEGDYQEDGSDGRYQYQLRRRSVIILENQARYQWKHSIPSRKKDNGKQRTIRYSLTFREMIKSNT